MDDLTAEQLEEMYGESDMCNDCSLEKQVLANIYMALDMHIHFTDDMVAEGNPDEMTVAEWAPIR